VSGLRKFVEHNLRHIRRLISGEYGNAAVVRQELAKHPDSITLLPEGKGGSIYHPSDRYIAFVDTETGEYVERQLNHREGEAEKCSVLGSKEPTLFDRGV
jgi:hypothetical protein